MNEAAGYIVYDMNGENINVDLSVAKGNYEVRWVNTLNGEVVKTKQEIKAGSVITLSKPKVANHVLWLVRK